MKQALKQIFLCVFLLFIPNSISFAYEVLEENHPEFVFQQNLYSIGLTQNIPADKSEEYLEEGSLHPVFGFKHFNRQGWLVGVLAQFKMLKTKDDESKAFREAFSILSVSQETKYGLRLYHPFYTFLGWKLAYLLPTEKGKVPIHRLKNFEAEIGFALSGSLFMFNSDKTAVSIYFDRWRGTKTRKLQGFEMGLELHFNW